MQNTKPCFVTSKSLRYDRVFGNECEAGHALSGEMPAHSPLLIVLLNNEAISVIIQQPAPIYVFGVCTVRVLHTLRTSLSKITKKGS